MALTRGDLEQRLAQEAVSSWVLVDQPMIDRFADATGDHQFIHVDPERAAHTPFGGTIAHGFLIQSLLPRLRDEARPDATDGARMEVNYGTNKLRFVSAVRSGKAVRGRFRTVEILEKRPGQFQVTTEATIEIDGETKPALICEWVTQLLS